MRLLPARAVSLLRDRPGSARATLGRRCRLLPSIGARTAAGVCLVSPRSGIRHDLHLFPPHPACRCTGHRGRCRLARPQQRRLGTGPAAAVRSRLVVGHLPRPDADGPGQPAGHRRGGVLLRRTVPAAEPVHPSRRAVAALCAGHQHDCRRAHRRCHLPAGQCTPAGHFAGAAAVPAGAGCRRCGAPARGRGCSQRHPDHGHAGFHAGRPGVPAAAAVRPGRQPASGAAAAGGPAGAPAGRVGGGR